MAKKTKTPRPKRAYDTHIAVMVDSGLKGSLEAAADRAGVAVSTLVRMWIVERLAAPSTRRKAPRGDASGKDDR